MAGDAAKIGGLLVATAIFLAVVMGSANLTSVTKPDVTNEPLPKNWLYLAYMNNKRSEYNMSNWWGMVVSDTAWGDIAQGWGYGDYFDQEYIDFLAEKGATGFRVMLDKYAWDLNAVNNLGYNYQTYITNLVSWCSTAGVNCYIDLTRDSYHGGEGYTEFGGADKVEVITDAGYKAAWIAWGVDVITTCSPDAISIMNEPLTASMADWLVFVDESITAYRAVDANLTIFVPPCPWWSTDDAAYIAAMNAYDSKVVSTFHFYYEYPPAGSSGANTARTAYGEGRFVDGKALMYAYLDYKFSGLTNSRCSLDEVGVYENVTRDPWTSTGVPNDTNWQRWMEDVYEYTVDRGLHGLFQYAIGYQYALVYWTSVALTPYGDVWDTGAEDPPDTPDLYTIVLTTTEGGTVSELQEYDLPYGTPLTIHAFPDSGYAFKHWQMAVTGYPPSGSILSTSNPIELTMIYGNVTLIAVFEQLAVGGQFLLTIQGPIGGTTNPPPGVHAYDPATVVAITCIIDDGYELDKWFVDGVQYGVPGNTIITVTMNANKTVTVHFNSTITEVPVISPTAKALPGITTRLQAFPMAVKRMEISNPPDFTQVFKKFKDVRI